MRVGVGVVVAARVDRRHLAGDDLDFFARLAVEEQDRAAGFGPAVGGLVGAPVAPLAATVGMAHRALPDMCFFIRIGGNFVRPRRVVLVADHPVLAPPLVAVVRVVGLVVGGD